MAVIIPNTDILLEPAVGLCRGYDSEEGAGSSGGRFHQLGRSDISSQVSDRLLIGVRNQGLAC